MNFSKQLIERTLNFEEVDHPPLYDLPHNDAMIDYYGKGDIFKAIDNSLDMTRNIRFPNEEKIVESDGFLIEQKRWTEWIRERPFKSQKEIQVWIKQEIEKIRNCDERRLQKEVQDVIENHLNQQSKLKHTHKILTGVDVGLTGIYHSIGLESFIYLYSDEPSLVSDLLEVKKDLNLKRINYLEEPARISPIIFVGEDIAYKGGPIFSPKFLEKEFFPRLKQIIEALHEKKLKIMFHSDGNLFTILDNLILCGIEGLNPLENMDLGKVRKKYPKLFLAGGIDCSNLLPFASPKEVKKVVKKAIKDAGRGYFLGSTSEIHPNIPLENIKAMIETGRKEKK